MKTDNELIAEFMGVIPDRYEDCIIADGSGRTELTPIYGRGVHEKLPHQLGYSESWDTLRPVIDKIDKLWEQYPIQDIINDIDQHRFLNVVGLSLAEEISVVYKNVVEFIKWYNKEKNP